MPRAGSLPRALVIGDVMTDVVVRPEGPILLGTDRRATIRTLPGGSGANQAAWLAHFDVPTRFAGRVGKADHAWQCTLLERAGIEPVLAADADLPTGTVVILLSPDGERSFLTERGANRNFSRADLPKNLLDGIGIVHVSGYALFEDAARTAVRHLLAEARRHGIPVTIDPSSEAFLREVGREAFLRWTEGAAICFPNAAEASVLAGSDDPEAQLDILARHCPLVVLKLGPSGVRAAAGEARWSAPAAAGDAFLGGFLAAHLGGRPVPDCLAQGVAAATQVIGRFGARPAAGGDVGTTAALPSGMESAL